MKSNAMERFFGRLLVAEERTNEARGQYKASAFKAPVGALHGASPVRTQGATPKSGKPGRTYTIARSQSPASREVLRNIYGRSGIPSATPPSPAHAVPASPSNVARSCRHAGSTLPRPPSRSQSRGRPTREPVPPEGLQVQNPQANVSRRHRLLGPMPEAPPASVLQSRPATSQPRSRMAIGTMRFRQYTPSRSPPRNGALQPTPPPHIPSNLPQPQNLYQHRSSASTALRRSMDDHQGSFTPDHLSKLRVHSSSHTERTPTSNIRHRSTTPVRVTKDVQLRRDQASTKQRRTPASQDSPLHRRAKSLARAANAESSRKSWDGVHSASFDRAFKPTPPPHQQTIAAGVARAAVSATSTAQARQPSRPLSKSLHPKDVPATSGSSAASTTTVTAQAAPRASESVRPPLKAGACESEGHLEGYELGPVIGEGGFCKVKSGRHVASQQPVAIKVINKNALKDGHDWRRVGREIRILKRLKNHPAVIHVYDVISVRSEVYVIQELAQGGSLLDYIRDRKRISEELAMRLFLQIVAGLQYCHQNEVVHRDIKLENLLMDSERNMKLIDFGLAAIFSPGVHLRVHCGSPSYAAPEIIGRQNYEGPPVDVWSLGIVTFAMVCGHLPFYSRNGRSDLSRKIMAGKYHAPEHMSESMKDIVAGMLTLDPSRRITLEQIMTHRWVSGSLCRRSVHLPRALLPYDGATRTYKVDQSVLDHMSTMGVPLETVLKDLQQKECNIVTATYFLLAEAIRDGKGLPGVTTSTRQLGATLHTRSCRAQPAHGFSLDIYESGDRDDQAHFAPSRSRRDA